MNGGWGISYEIALTWIPLTEDKSKLVHVMAWCRQATSHYLSQCWPRSLSPYGVTRHQWLKTEFLSHRQYNEGGPNIDHPVGKRRDWDRMTLHRTLWLWENKLTYWKQQQQQQQRTHMSPDCRLLSNMDRSQLLWCDIDVACCAIYDLIDVTTACHHDV